MPSSFVAGASAGITIVGPQPEPVGRERNGLRMVTGRERHDTGAALFLRELQQSIQRTANLEAAGMLQTFGLQEHAQPDARDSGSSDSSTGRLDDPPAQARRSGGDIGDGRQIGGHG